MTNDATPIILVLVLALAALAWGVRSFQKRVAAETAMQQSRTAAQKRVQERETTLIEHIADSRNPADVLALCDHSPPVSLRFQKSEEPVWVVPDCTYLKTTKNVTFHGRSAGASFRVAKGMTIRTGGSRGRREETEDLQAVDTGTAVLTTKHIYFQGSDKDRFRVRLDKLVSTEAAGDGFLFQRDGVRARPEAFASYDARMLAVLIHWLEALDENHDAENDTEIQRNDLLDALTAMQSEDAESFSENG